MARVAQRRSHSPKLHFTMNSRIVCARKKNDFFLFQPAQEAVQQVLRCSTDPAIRAKLLFKQTSTVIFGS